MPRNIVGPLVRGKDLYGREGDVAYAWRLLERGSILIAAPRRHGKSSVMSALVDAPLPGWRPILVDVESETSPQELVTRLTAELLQHEQLGGPLRQAAKRSAGMLGRMAARLEEVSVGVGGLGEARLRLREAAPPDSWQAIGEQLFNSLADASDQVVLILDGFPIYLSSLLEADEARGVAFLRWFRSQRNRVERLRFVVGGSVNIEPTLELLGQTTTINDLQRMRIEPFSSAIGVAFVREVLSAEGIEYEPEVPDRVCMSVGTLVPFFLQVLIGEVLVAGRGRRVTAADVSEAYERRVLGPDNRARFAHYESRLRGYGVDEDAARRVLANLAQQPADEAMLSAAVRHVDLRRVLARLESDYYTVRNGHVWSFHSVLLREWWLRNARIPS